MPMPSKRNWSRESLNRILIMEKNLIYTPPEAEVVNVASEHGFCYSEINPLDGWYDEQEI